MRVRLPAALQHRLDLRERSPAMAGVGVDAIAVDRLVVVPVMRGDVVRHALVQLLEMAEVLATVARLGDPVAGTGADRDACHRTDRHAWRPGHRAQCRPGNAAGEPGDAGTDDMVLLEDAHGCLQMRRLCAVHTTLGPAMFSSGESTRRNGSGPLARP